MHTCPAAILALVLACADKDDENNTSGGTGDAAAGDEGGDDGGDGACATLDVDACPTRSDCRLITGRQMVETAPGVYCVEDWTAEMVPVGCMDADGGCGDAETIAAPAKTPETCDWWFPNTCVPAGWVACDHGEKGHCDR